MRSFAKIELSKHGKITLPFTDICNSYPSHEFFNF